jgi:hypothetical protein
MTVLRRVYTTDLNDLRTMAGRVVISTGRIKTDIPTEDDYKQIVWMTRIDKEGIYIEGATPVVQLSRNKKDKRVFGVLGNINDDGLLDVNSVGTGTICVSNTNGNIENGDFIQSSDLLGYGEKQDDDIIRSYTIGKATIDCNFELDSPYYQSHEIENGVRVAFIVCSYHCGSKYLLIVNGKTEDAKGVNIQ